MLSATPYDHEVDFDRVARFLIETYEPGNTFTNWLQPRWEYMHFHTNVADAPIDKIGIFERRGEIVGVVHPEHSPVVVYLQVRPGAENIKDAMINYAEEHFGGFSERLQRNVLGIYVNEFDEEFSDIVTSRRFALDPLGAEENSLFVAAEVAAPVVPDGFEIRSLEEENDLEKINAVLWRGFNHAGPPPADGVAGREVMQRAPGFRKDLTIVAVAPDGKYAAFGGMWFVPENRVAYVEPVATDPDFRRMGLGAAVVLESVRRVIADGAEAVWVGSNQEFYKAIGFETTFKADLWLKDING